MTFANRLFDAKFEFVPGDTHRQDLVKPTRQERRSRPTWKLDDDQLLRLAEPGADLAQLAGLGGGSCSEALHAEETITDLKAALVAGPVEARVLQRRLWPDSPEAAKRLEALVALGSRVLDDVGNPVLSARYHLFVRATEGAFVSFSESGPRIFLGRHEIDPDTGRAVFEFGTCQRCGAVHLAGDVEHKDKKQYFVPSTRNDAAVKWLVLTDGDADTTVDEDEVTLSEGHSQTDPTVRYLCVGCGLLSDSSSGSCAPSCPGGGLRRVREHKATAAVMSRCTECGALARQVIRRLRTDVNAAPAVITTALYQELPIAEDETADQVGGGRKLLMFSDSRQAAAFAAPYLNRTYGRLLERRYITQALQDPPKYADDEHSLEDLAIIAKKKAEQAGHFDEHAGSAFKNRAVNEWVMGELITMEVRQSLEGLGLMRVSLKRPADALPKAFASLGLTEDEAWSLLDELVRTVRMQGALSLLDDVDIKAERFAPRNARIRLRYKGSDQKKKIISWVPSAASSTNSRIRYLAKVLAALGVDAQPEAILEGCWKYLESQKFFVIDPDARSGTVYQLDQRKLLAKNGLDCDWYQCNRCRRITAFSVRDVCPTANCDGQLQRYELPNSGVDTNHYRVAYETMATAPMDAEEHTAQLSPRKAAEIQQDFVAGRVNVLSCSTTFELGVDVGDLQSVVMRNMPPKTANYVQRAGRAGRRSESAALVLTYAKRASHDLAKYQYPQTMIAGQMRIPWVPIDNAMIARRHAYSIAMAAYFRHSFEQGLTWQEVGEFFLPGGDGQDSPAARVQSFLNPVPAGVKAALQAAIPEAIHSDVGVHDDSWVDRLVDLLDKVEREVAGDNKLFNELIAVAAGEENYRRADRLKKTLETIKKRKLIGFLANRNILPKYGFPVDTVDLNTLHCAEPIGARLRLERNLSLAIYDYAPGNQVVAGGKVWMSRGLKQVPGRELVRRQYRICQQCKRYESGHVLEAGSPCPTCGESFGAIRTVVVPEFGFVADRRATEVGTSPPSRTWNGATYVEDVGEEIDTFTLSGAAGTAVEARAGTRATLAVISEGLGTGYYVCEWCGWADAAGKGAWPKNHERPQSGNGCTGPLERLTLGHRYQSDVAEFTFKGFQYQDADESNWRSTLYAMLEGASVALEISRDDIDGALAWTSDNRRSIVLFDTVPGGAGAAKKIAENIDLVVRAAIDRVAQCDCGPETSCYGCLRSYRNASFHDQLSRNGALALLEPLGLLGIRSGMSEAWGGLIDLAAETVKALLSELGRRGLAEPEIGIELGKYYWPVEVAWPLQRVVIVDGDDEERNQSLAADGFAVFHVGVTDADEIEMALAETGSPNRDG